MSAEFPAGLEEVVVTGRSSSTGVQQAQQQGRQGAQAGPELRSLDELLNLVELGRARDSVQALARVEPGEEIWVIATPSADRSQGNEEANEPGTGAMLATLISSDPAVARDTTQVPLPLKHTTVHAVVTGYVSTVDVTQHFENPFSEKIEAVYVFPLPEKAAVSEFVMTIGERKIRGILRERAEAEEIYREARSQGYQASLLTQHRPNIFEQKVANIEPGKQIVAVSAVL